MKKVTVGDLKPQSGPGPHPVLHCQLCGSTFSANAGDYGVWNGSRKDDVFNHCGRPMRLVFKRVIFVEATVGS
jgi:hypothetical protein